MNKRRFGVMKKVLTVGVFDYFHYGHLKLFERAKALGDYLIVAVQRDEEIHKTKPNANILYSLDKRLEMVSSIKFVDEVLPYAQIYEDIQKIDFDIFVKGGDQTHSGFVAAEKWCLLNGKQIVTLSRTPNICSSDIKREIGK